MSIYEALKKAVQEYDHNGISLSFLKRSDGISKQRLDTLDCSFMYTQILKEILLSIDFVETHFKEFFSYCREQYVGNSSELRKIDKIEKEYNAQHAIQWYTYESFLFSMVNRALRMMDVELIVNMGFFICDLHNHITTLHSEQYGKRTNLDFLRVYRGQGLSQMDFDQLEKDRGWTNSI